MHNRGIGVVDRCMPISPACFTAELPASVDDVLHDQDVAAPQRGQIVTSQDLDLTGRLVILER